ncbi:MAG: hypothetical protein OFPII_07600 [Osedax symbiont Rs1]|nr:MAG: hypothetical protein OFPII_07600 [Osedax symbiont Rs1]
MASGITGKDVYKYGGVLYTKMLKSTSLFIINTYLDAWRCAIFSLGAV